MEPEVNRRQREEPSEIDLATQAYKALLRPVAAVPDKTWVMPSPKIALPIPKGQVEPMRLGASGDAVMELRIRLAGFGGLHPGEVYDKETEAAVKIFEKDVMARSPTGEVDFAFAQRLDQFASDWPILVESQLACPCATKRRKFIGCDGFGLGKFRDGSDTYWPWAGTRSEEWHKYEYPGMHRSLLWGARALMFYSTFDLKDQIRFHQFSSGYRCHEDNFWNSKVKSDGTKKLRTSTNHMGKAVDMHFTTFSGDAWKRSELSGEANFTSCNKVRDMAVHRLKASIHWETPHQFGLEPGGPNIDKGQAYDWVHMDVREWAAIHLDDKFFTKTTAGLNGDSMSSLMLKPGAFSIHISF
jgi:hypothetical protein